MLETVETIATIAVMAAVAWATIRGRSSDDAPTPQERYVRGEIDEQQLESELAFHVDERNDAIRAVVKDVNGVGPDTSKAIAREYEDLDGLRETDKERLESVAGIGDARAESVLELVRDE